MIAKESQNPFSKAFKPFKTGGSEKEGRELSKLHVGGAANGKRDGAAAYQEAKSIGQPEGQLFTLL
ncbi:hypothetical protein J31TS6_13860 [Brevibacillus reuszeri]|nr:hypothetical protein J31TS6_13860 [Brevibacillus reuszeri]